MTDILSLLQDNLFQSILVISIGTLLPVAYKTPTRSVVRGGHNSRAYAPNRLIGVIIKMVSLKGFGKFKPHLSQIIVQVVATFAIAPFAYLFERKKRPPLTWPVLFQIFLLGSGIAIIQNAYIPGLYYTSSTFGAAAFNLVPVLTIAMATFLRLEKVNIRSFRGQAKVVGTVICVGGAMVMALYKGPALKILSLGEKGHRVAYNSKHNIILGSILVFGGVVVWSACTTFQAPVLKRYPAQLSLTALTSLIGAVESALIGVICENTKPNLWAEGWNIEILSVLYAGIICSGFGMFLQVWCISKKGPVFVAIFNPVGTIVTAVLELIIVHVYLHVGSVVGAILIVVGLYTTLWGKARDMKTEDADESSNNIMTEETLESENSIIQVIEVTKADTNPTKQETSV